MLVMLHDMLPWLPALVGVDIPCHEMCSASASLLVTVTTDQNDEPAVFQHPNSVIT